MLSKLRASHVSLACGLLTAAVLVAFVSVEAQEQKSQAQNSQQQNSNEKSPAEVASANEILTTTGVQGGLILHLGCGDGRLTAALQANDRYQVQGLDVDAQNVATARKHIMAQGSYGPVAVDLLVGQQLPYIDNLINLAVVSDLSGVSRDELLRVLVPEGVAYIRQGNEWEKVVKPRPDNIDEWTHYLHDASGNAVAHDDVVGPPKHLQWLGSPRWSRHHDRMASMSALVSAGGRLFYIMDEGSRISIQMPPSWTLVARDAFNGTILWKKPITTWRSHLWPLKSGPTQLARRLVATGGKVYVTLAIDAPVTSLDAATGEVLHEFADSGTAEELIVQDGVMLALVNKGKSELEDFAPAFNTGDQARVAKEFIWNGEPRQIMAFDTETGKELWKLPTRVSPLTMSADAERVFFHDGEKVVCLDKRTGQPKWNSPKADRRAAMTMNFGPRLVLHDNIVLFAGGDHKMRAFSKEDGKELWEAPHAQSGYQSPEDLLVANGLVWNAPTTRTQDTGVFTGRDPQTGEVKVEFPPDINTYWFHHRCYIAKATDKFLMPSRTGIEFVDIESKEWDINHWVRGGCLYGVMPCNGMVYAPPHNCACYPEAKIYGMNALAPATPTRELLTQEDKANRLQKGPAFGQINDLASKPNPEDWPTYRHDSGRTGSSTTSVSPELKKSWQADLSGKLSSVVVAGGRLFVAQVEQHTLHALDANSGEKLWSFTTGGRIDSPPTISRERVLFGSMDGYVYCLRASDGALAWRFRAAPRDLRLAAFEQIESVWPVHGNVLVKNNEVVFVAGRSNFLDGGLRFYRVNVDTGEKLAEHIIDDRDPETGGDIQDRLQVLQMPSGLPDILSSDGESIYMRSQRFDLEGNRLELGPHSGQPDVQGGTQDGKTAHLFAPMGFLDDTWFHRSYWVYGRSFAGGHSGYYQAAKYAPAGRLLVVDDLNVYGFGRKPEYLKWTTTMEHQLFSASRQLPEEALGEEDAEAQKAARRGQANTNMVNFENSKSLNPANTPLAIMAWVNAEQPGGVIVARGGPSVGYALTLDKGRPQWTVRVSPEKVVTVTGTRNVVGEWTHLAGVLTKDKLELYVNGQLAADADSPGLIPSDPQQSMQLGGDDRGAVGNYKSPNQFLGTIDELRLYHGQLKPRELELLSSLDADERKVTPRAAALQLACSFDEGKATDESGNKNNGTLDGNRPTAGTFGNALRFQGRRAGKAGGSFVKHHWHGDVPLLARAMVKAGDTIFVAGPPDLIDEEETFQRIMDRDPEVQKELSEQNEALQGKQGGRLLAVSAADGETLSEYKLESLPAWDSMAAAAGKLFFATEDGKIICMDAKNAGVNKPQE